MPVEPSRIIEIPLQPVRRVLVIDDKESDRNTVREFLSDEYEVYEASGGGEALAVLNRVNIDVILLDIRLGEEDGLELLEKIKNHFFNVEIIMISVLKDIPLVVEAMQKGAFDYLVKGFSREELCTRVERAFERIQVRKQIQLVAEGTEEEEELKTLIIGRNRHVQKIFEVAEKIARLPSTILITGESGTGKEILARYIHNKSPFSDGPFVTVNVNNLTPELAESVLFGHEKGAFTGATQRHFGKFELADGGTIFLDEIGDTPVALQGKLLRVLQTGEFERVGGERTVKVRTRIIAATNKNLKRLVREGKFREDLYYRLNVIPLHLPPLRERKEDIPDFINYFITRYSRMMGKEIRGIDESVLKILMEYSWPGNIRELQNLIERLVALNETGYIEMLDLPMEYYVDTQLERSARGEGPGQNLKDLVDEFERNLLLYTLKKARGNQTLAAAMLNIARSTLRYKLKYHGIKEP